EAWGWPIGLTSSGPSSSSPSTTSSPAT
ncbi:hypothetical protein CFC21_001622, partial [Triticum aestivum]